MSELTKQSEPPVPPSSEDHEGNNDGFPRSVVIEYNEKSYDAISEEELLTGMNKSTLANRAAQVYKLIMDAHRVGKRIALIDETGNGETIRIDDI